jgi:hypothetical protein
MTYPPLVESTITVESSGVHNVITKVMKLTWGKLLKGPDWDEWQSSEYLQLNQYHTQGMFGTPMLVDEEPWMGTSNCQAFDSPVRRWARGSTNLAQSLADLLS